MYGQQTCTFNSLPVKRWAEIKEVHLPLRLVVSPSPWVTSMFQMVLVVESSVVFVVLWNVWSKVVDRFLGSWMKYIWQPRASRSVHLDWGVLPFSYTELSRCSIRGTLTPLNTPLCLEVYHRGTPQIYRECTSRVHSRYTSGCPGKATTRQVFDKNHLTADKNTPCRFNHYMAHIYNCVRSTINLLHLHRENLL